MRLPSVLFGLSPPRRWWVTPFSSRDSPLSSTRSRLPVGEHVAHYETECATQGRQPLPHRPHDFTGAERQGCYRRRVLHQARYHRSKAGRSRHCPSCSHRGPIGHAIVSKTLTALSSPGTPRRSECTVIAETIIGRPISIWRVPGTSGRGRGVADVLGGGRGQVAHYETIRRRKDGTRTPPRLADADHDGLSCYSEWHRSSATSPTASERKPASAS